MLANSSGSFLDTLGSDLRRRGQRARARLAAPMPRCSDDTVKMNAVGGGTTQGLSWHCQTNQNLVRISCLERSEPRLGTNATRKLRERNETTLTLCGGLTK